MKLRTVFTGAASAALVYTVDARPQDQVNDAKSVQRRALPANYPHGYTPQVGDCPSDTPKVRDANRLSDEETSWLEVRRNATLEPMKALLNRMNITGLNTDDYMDNHKNNASAVPNIAIAASGGGYRAMLNAAGYIEAWDSRTTNSTSDGQLGGLLQSTTYLAGLSGGSWLVGSLYTNNFTSIDTILAQDTSDDDSGDLWQLGNSIFEGPDSGGIQLLDSVGYYNALLEAVNGKSDAGFDTTLTDYWGRALSYQLVNATDGGPAFTWSSIASQDWFTSGSVPLPIIVADSRKPGQATVSTNSTIFQFDPWELGSFDPTVYAFAPLKYVGSNFTSGTVKNTSACVTGFDNVGFVYGTSSTLFNSVLAVVNGTQTTGLFSSALQDALTSILEDLGEDDEDIADWVNPFFGYHNDSNPFAVSPQLTLVDGGEDNENVPLEPLIQPHRAVDVIFAIDSSADTNTSWPTDDSAANWPNGASLIATYERSLVSEIQNGTAFPSIPDINTFVNLGLNNGPTFFGCDVSNLTGPSPLIVYLPNAPYAYTSNVSTYDLSYNDTERNAIVLNAYDGATQGNGTLDSQWPACVGCAILSRSLDRTGTDVPDVCTQCFDRYCWNGTTNATHPGSYVPEIKLDEVKVTSAAAASGRISAVAAAVGCLVAATLAV